MSTSNPNFKYGALTFRYRQDLDLASVNYMIVPEGYLAQDRDNPERLYMFRTLKELTDYFTDFTKLQIKE